VPEPATLTHVVPPLAIERLSYAYPHADPTGSTSSTPEGQKAELVLREVSLTLAPGEFALLAGRSACGKTTLLRA